MFSLERNFKNRIKQASSGCATCQASVSHCPCAWTLFLPPLLARPGAKFGFILALSCLNQLRAVQDTTGSSVHRDARAIPPYDHSFRGLLRLTEDYCAAARLILKYESAFQMFPLRPWGSPFHMFAELWASSVFDVECLK